jgi:hypothetical protein
MTIVTLRDGSKLKRQVKEDRIPPYYPAISTISRSMRYNIGNTMLAPLLMASTISGQPPASARLPGTGCSRMMKRPDDDAS